MKPDITLTRPREPGLGAVAGRFRFVRRTAVDRDATPSLRVNSLPPCCFMRALNPSNVSHSDRFLSGSQVPLHMHSSSTSYLVGPKSVHSREPDTQSCIERHCRHQLGPIYLNQYTVAWIVEHHIYGFVRQACALQNFARLYLEYRRPY